MKPFETTLKQHGYSITRARRMVFKALQAHGPLEMHALIRHVDAIDRASVYRIIALFESVGIANRIQSGWKYRLELGDAFNEHHHHAICLSCGVSLDVPEDARLEVRLYELADLLDFQLERHQLELQGYCSNCHHNDL